VARVAVVLFNLGGPDERAAVQPFLRNLFSDPAIIALPQPWRRLLAMLLAARRAPVARAIYDKIGGSSPILANTMAQAQALEAVLGGDYRCFVAMRYWRPRAEETAKAVAAWRPDAIVLMPLYPQFSTTTTASSLAEWQSAAARAGLAVPSTTLCCHPDEPGFIAALAERSEATMRRIPSGTPLRILFSAHGLPKRIVRAGDPYQWQVEATAAALRRRLGLGAGEGVVCYQSRVGPLEWLGPATDAEIRRAAGEGLGILVVPIVFVSEHSETLVELDIEYRHLAEAGGARGYWRAPCVGTHPAFIAGLAQLVRAGTESGPGIYSSAGGRICPAGWTRCALGGAR